MIVYGSVCEGVQINTGYEIDDKERMLKRNICSGSMDGKNQRRERKILGLSKML